MRILFAGSEMSPFVGGRTLGDALGALPAAVAARGHEVSVVLPGFRAWQKSGVEFQATGVEFLVAVGFQQITARIHEGTAPNGVQLFLVEQDDYFERAGLYGEDGRPYDDNAARFIFFAKAVVELARRILPQPEILHVHGWQAALVPVLLKERRLPFRSVLTLHHLAEQGRFWAFDFGLTNLPGDYFSARGVEFFGEMNLLKGGILFADRVTTTSARYAREIQSPTHGAGLDAVLREQSGKLSGILAGLDDRTWNPAADRLLPETFSASDPSGKTACRDALLAQSVLDPAPAGPVLALVVPLVQTSHLALLLPLLDRLLSADVRLVVLGASEAAAPRELAIARRRNPGRLAFLPIDDEAATHLVFAGADVLLLPSGGEPATPGARAALRYGTLPLAQATDGLSETIRDHDPTSQNGNGIVFDSGSPEALWDALRRTLLLFQEQKTWARLRQRAMNEDFSWARAAEGYEAVYKLALLGPR